jgi:DNA invertase Pin-like site-specific DNA recombinase
MHLLETAQVLESKQVNLVSLRENIDTNTAAGRCFLFMMGTIHQMEREPPRRTSRRRPGLCKGAREDRRAATHQYRQVERCQSTP